MLVVVLEDGCAGTIDAEATDALEPEARAGAVTVMTVEGIRELRRLVDLLRSTKRTGSSALRQHGR